MKKQNNSTLKAHFLRSALYLLLLLAISPIPFALAQRSPTKQRKQSQNAIAPQPLTVPSSNITGDKFAPVRIIPDAPLGPVRFQNVENPASVLDSLTANALLNNNNGVSACNQFTQSETSVVSFGSTIIVGFNDAGSGASGSHYTGWSRSTDDGSTWTDGGTLPTGGDGDAGDPVLARDNTSGRIYFATLAFIGSAIPVFSSTDGGATWLVPANGAPGKSGMQDKEWITVDNFSGSGNGNVYLVERDFGTGNGIYFFRSTDGGANFEPNGGTPIVVGMQGAFVTVNPDHSVQAWWYDGPSIKVRKSTDEGVNFGPPVTVVTFTNSGGINGDLSLGGVLNGTNTVEHFRTNRFPHVAVNPVTGNIYVAYNDQGTEAGDHADIFLVQSTDGGANWSAPIRVNDDATIADQWFPNVVVSPAGDQIGIFYYSRQEDAANNNLFKYYGRIGTISGATITLGASAAISDTASFPEFDRDNMVEPGYMGDYDQAYARSGGFDVVWSDNRSDLPSCAPVEDPNVYYQTVALTTPTPTPCDSGIIANGGFETGSFSPWVIQDSSPTPVASTLESHSGTFSGHVGSLPGGESPGDSSFYQTITVPAGGGTLSYWYWPRTVDTIHFDWQDAYVTDTSGTILAIIMHLCSNTQEWTNVTFNMAPYAGMTVRIKFLLHGDDGGDATDMFVDDVQLLVPCPAPTPTPTPKGVGVEPAGYWTNHPRAWCVSSITLGCITYSQAQAIAIMRNPDSIDMTYKLARQLAAAKLNVGCLGTDLSCVANAIAAADSWLCRHRIGSRVTAHSQEWRQVTPTYNILASYNSGLLCAPPAP